MGQWYDNVDFCTYLSSVEFLQPEQTSRFVVDEIVATDGAIFCRNNLQGEFNIRRQLNVIVSSLNLEVTQKLIGRFRDNEKLLGIVQVCIRVDSLKNGENVRLCLKNTEGYSSHLFLMEKISGAFWMGILNPSQWQNTTATGTSLLWVLINCPYRKTLTQRNQMSRDRPRRLYIL